MVYAGNYTAYSRLCVFCMLWGLLFVCFCCVFFVVVLFFCVFFFFWLFFCFFLGGGGIHKKKKVKSTCLMDNRNYTCNYAYINGLDGLSYISHC